MGPRVRGDDGDIGDTSLHSRPGRTNDNQIARHRFHERLGRTSSILFNSFPL
jgi:hypothetical protein